MTAYTNRGTKWELAASWWILLTVVPFGLTSFIAFLYAGGTAGNRRWTIYGFAYLAAIIIALVTTVVGVGAFIAVAAWILSVIHAFKARPAFLVQLDMRLRNKNSLDEQRLSQLRQDAESLLKVKDQAPTVQKAGKEAAKAVISNSYDKKTDSDKARNELAETLDSLNRRSPLTEEGQRAASETQDRIEINRASETELASVPEIGIVLAKKVVLQRKELGGFESFEQFARLMNLRDQAATKLETRLAFAPLEKTKADNQLKQGRMIDF